MKLVVRATVWIFLFLTISSSAIGYFAISKYQSSQINIIGDSLNGKIKALSSTSEDPLTVSQYLAQISDIPLTVEYISDTGTVTVLSVSGPNIPNLPPSALLNQARHDDVNYGPQLRIRTFQMANQKKLLFAESLSTINAEVKTLTRELIFFIVVIDLIAALAAFFVFKRDGKINQVSHLMAQQQVVMQKFLGDASHELRTPLTVIKGYVDLARNSSNLKKIEGYLDKSAKEIFRMESLIQDLLFLAEVGEAQSDRRESVDLGKILKEYLEVLEALNPERTVSIKLSGNSVILADPRLMDRMIGNIFSNIRRHTPVDASVNASITKSGKELIIMIEDGGQGLSEYPDKPRQIKRFTSQRSPEGGGTGLGMSIIAGIIERYEGTLMLSQSSLGGLNVKISLPLP
jgi:two-component system OmpR family sensor kinase